MLTVEPKQPTRYDRGDLRDACAYAAGQCNTMALTYRYVVATARGYHVGSLRDVPPGRAYIRVDAWGNCEKCQ